MHDTLARLNARPLSFPLRRCRCALSSSVYLFSCCLTLSTPFSFFRVHILPPVPSSCSRTWYALLTLCGVLWGAEGASGGTRGGTREVGFDAWLNLWEIRLCTPQIRPQICRVMGTSDELGVLGYFILIAARFVRDVRSVLKRLTFGVKSSELFRR